MTCGNVYSVKKFPQKEYRRKHLLYKNNGYKFNSIIVPAIPTKSKHTEQKKGKLPKTTEQKKGTKSQEMAVVQ